MEDVVFIALAEKIQKNERRINLRKKKSQKEMDALFIVKQIVFFIYYKSDDNLLGG